MTDKAGTASNVCGVGRGGNILHISFSDNTGTPQDKEEVLDHCNDEHGLMRNATTQMGNRRMVRELSMEL